MRSRWSAGSRTRTATRSRPSGTPSSTCGRSPICGRGPTRSARSRGSAIACHGRPPLFPRARFCLGHTPIITTSDAEGAGAMFRVSTLDLANLPRDEHGPNRLLGRLLRQAGEPDRLRPAQRRGLLPGADRVYTFGPTFRAENSNTTRHLAEFWMIEPEIAFADLDDNADLAEDFLKYSFAAVLKERADDMAFFAQHIDKGLIAQLEGIINANFERMDYGDAIAVSSARQGAEVRVPGQVGHRPPVRARALPDRAIREKADRRDELSQGDQGVLHAGRTTTAGPSPRWTCWRRASAR